MWSANWSGSFKALPAGSLVAKANVIKFEHVEQAVDELRTEYNFSLTRDEYISILQNVHETKELRYREEEPLLHLLHNLFILEYPNSPGWYEVNPIVHKLIGVGA